MPTQPIENPNNKARKPAYNTRNQTLPTYVITTVQLQQLQLRSGKVLHQKPLVVIEEENEEEQQQQHQQQEIPQQVPGENKNTTPPILLQEQERELKNPIQLSRTPPYLERLALEKHIVPPEFDIEV